MGVAELARYLEHVVHMPQALAYLAQCHCLFIRQAWLLAANAAPRGSDFVV
ncbi:hypothetical protein [Limnohabitans sp.]|uniref:hypothetical protein n=1 Tax=Limnohabitans sp. TaxID=1907725 RepID=UPI00333F866D